MQVPVAENFDQTPGAAPSTRFTDTLSPDAAAAPARQMQEAGQAMQRMGRGVANVAIDMQNTASQVRVSDALNQARQAQLDLTYNPEGGFANVKGRDAIYRDSGQSLPEEYTGKLQQQLNDIAGTLTNPVQRRMYELQAQGIATSFQGDVERHFLGEFRNYHDSVNKGSLTLLEQQAGANWHDPAKLQDVLRGTVVTGRDGQPLLDDAGKPVRMGGIWQVLHDQGRLNGQSDEEIAANQLTATSAIHTRAIESAIANSQTDYAQNYFDQVKGQLMPDDALRLQAQLKTGTLKDQSLSLSLQMAGQPLKEATKQLDDMFSNKQISADVRDATLTRLEHNYQVQKTQEAEGDKALLGASYDWLIKNPSASVLDLPPNLYGWAKQRGYLDDLATFARNGGRYQNDPQAWADIMSMDKATLRDMTPTDFYNRYRGKLDDGHLEKGYALIASANGSAGKDHLEIMTPLEMVKNAAQKAGVLPYNGKPSENQAKAFDTFSTEIDKRVAAFEQGNLQGKRKATQEELQQIIDRTLMDKVYVDSWGFDPQKPLAVVNQDDQGNAYVKVGSEDIKLASIPATQRALIVSKLQARNIPVTEQTVAELWVRAGKPQ